MGLDSCALRYFTKITDVTIQNGGLMETINQYAFANCPNLLTVQIPNSVRTIRKFAFQGSPQVILIFTNGTNSITFNNLDSIKAILYYRTAQMQITYEFSWYTFPIYTYNSNLINLKTPNIRLLSEIEEVNENTSYSQLVNIIFNKKSSNDNKNKTSYQKSKSPLNLLLITEIIIKM